MNELQLSNNTIMAFDKQLEQLMTSCCRWSPAVVA